MFVFALNIALVIAGIIIPIGTAIFWAMAARRLNHKFDGKSDGIVLHESVIDELIKWLYHNRSKFNAIVVAIVTIIEFFAVMPL